MMFDLKFHYCQRRMAAYLNGELPTAARRRVARYIDEHPRCAALYRQQRAVRRELDATLPAFGRPSAGELDRIWSGIQAGMQPVTMSRGASPLRIRYGLGVLAVITLLWLPLLLVNHPVAALSPATQPDPRVQVVAATASPEESLPPIIAQTAQQTVRAQGAEARAAAVPPETPPPAQQ